MIPNMEGVALSSYKGLEVPAAWSEERCERYYQWTLSNGEYVDYKGFTFPSFWTTEEKELYYAQYSAGSKQGSSYFIPAVVVLLAAIGILFYLNFYR